MDKIFKRNAYSLTEVSKLNDINPSFSSLTFANERLVVPKSRCYLLLCQSCLSSGFAQMFEKYQVGLRKDRFFHVE